MKGPTKIERIKSMTNKSISSTIGTILHSNEMIVWNECLIRGETRAGSLRTGDAFRLGVKCIKHFL